MQTDDEEAWTAIPSKYRSDSFAPVRYPLYTKSETKTNPIHNTASPVCLSEQRSQVVLAGKQRIIKLEIRTVLMSSVAVPT